MAVKAKGQITLSAVVDVKSVHWFYLLQSATLADPSKPNAFPPASPWEETEPSYTTGSTDKLFIVECTVFCDDTFEYSEVSLSSSYEAAKVAYNKAIEAAKTATNFLSYDGTNGLQVGNKSSGSWVGYRTQMKSDSFNILDSSGNQLASYGANKIELGKNSQDTEIDFCDGLMSLKYDTSRDAAYLSSSNGSLILYSENTNTSGDKIYSEVQALSGGLSLASSLSADGVSVDDYSNIWLSKGQGRWDSSEYIMMTAPIVNVTGDFGVDGTVDATGKITIDPGNTTYTPFISKRKISSTTYSAEFGLGNPATGKASAMLTLKKGTTTQNSFNLRDDGMTISTGTVAAPGGFFSQHSSTSTPWSLAELESNECSFGRGSYDNGTGYSTLWAYSAYIVSKTNIVLRPNDNASGQIILASLSSKASIYPGTNGGGYCGGASYRWSAVYAVNGAIQTSDRNQKENILDVDVKYEALFNRLRPVSYELKGNEHDRKHIGFVSQEVKDSMDEVGLTADDFAAYCEDIKTEYDEGTGEEKTVLDENGDPVKLYSLRYSEFIALNTHMIQKLMNRVAKLENQISEMKGETA